MKPLIVLISVFVFSVCIVKVFFQTYDLALCGRIAMSAMLLFTAVGHFVLTKGMVMMIPPFMPFKTFWVYFTGILEIGAAIGLLMPGFHKITGWLLILFFILILPANIYAAVEHVDYTKATKDGTGPGYLWFRIPLQILFILWTYFSAIRF